MKRIFALLFSLVFVLSCDEYDVGGLFFSSSPTSDARFASSSEYNASHPVPDIKAGRNDYRVYICADLHINGTADNTRKYVNACLNDNSAELFSLCLGDMISCSGHMPLAIETLKNLGTHPFKFFSTPGNHDLCFNQWEEYSAEWKSSSYTFKVITPSDGTDLYICLDSADGTLGPSQTKWLEGVLSDLSSYRNVIVFTHTHFFKKDNSQGHTSNFNLEETYYLLDLFSRSGVDFVLSGHDHFFEKTQFRGVIYYTLAALEESKENGSYYVATVSDGFELEEITR